MNTQSGEFCCRRPVTAALTSGAIGQQERNSVRWPSLPPVIQCAGRFDRGVAMLHSYWFLIARRKFEGFCSRIPPARWHTGVLAMDYLGNTLATTPTRPIAGGLGRAGKSAGGRGEDAA